MTIQYQGVWSLQSAAQLQSTQRWVTDPLYKNTTLLLQADDAANGAQNNTFLDSSSNAFAITRNGGNPGMTQGSFTPFSSQPGAWSNYFDGTGDYITAAGANLALGTGNFTIEFWFYANAYSATADSSFMFDSRSGNNTSGFSIGPVFNNTQTLHVGQNASPIITANRTYPLNTWIHCAVVRSSGVITLYQDGVSVGSVANTTNNTATTNYIGSGWWLPSGAGQMFNGYLSNLRISNTARYTANFNPSANVFVSDGNTVLLTCQSNRFVDGSSNGYTITVGGGTPSVQAFSPFAPQFQWTPSVIGGSGYFDGTTDTLTAANNAAFQFGTGDFEVSGWVYPTSYASVRGFFSNGVASNGTLFSNLTTAGRFESWIYGDAVQTPTINIPLNAWTYLTISRVGTAFRTFVNGVQDISYTTSRDISAQGCIVGDAFTNGGFLFQGYISSVRVRKGSGVSSVTVPTAPSTAITNTQLLLNFTNAGIYDGTMKNVLETVGNAQISTAVVKYGSGSLAFDGTGDYLISNSGTDLYAFGSGDFTIEMWVNFAVVGSSGVYTLYDSRPNGTQGAYASIALDRSTAKIYYYVSSAIRITGSVTIVANTWYHVAICRSGTSTRLFVNGTQDGSTWTDTTTYLNPVNRPVIAASGSSLGTEATNGYMDDIRITKGIGRYTQNFIPPSVALPRQ